MPTASVGTCVSGSFETNSSEPRQDAAGLDWKAEDLAELAEHDADGDAVHETDEHGLAEEVGDEAEPKEPSDDAHQPGEHRKRHSQRAVERRVPARERRDNSRDHRAGRRVGIDDQLPGCAEYGVDDERQYRRIEANHRRKAGKLRVGNRDRAAQPPPPTVRLQYRHAATPFGYSRSMARPGANRLKPECAGVSLVIIEGHSRYHGLSAAG